MKTRTPRLGGILISIGLLGLTARGGPFKLGEFVLRTLLAFVFLVGLDLVIDNRKGPE